MEDVKQKLIDTVSQMLNEGIDVKNITVRQITSRLGISVSAINYHFGNKDNLIKTVVRLHIDDIIAKVPLAMEQMGSLPVREKLCRMLKLTADYLVKFPSISRVSILSDLQNGYGDDNTFHTIKAYAPMVREIVGEENSVLYGMIMAYTMQGIFMRMDALRQEGIIDFADKARRDDIIDRMMLAVLPDKT